MPEDKQAIDRMRCPVCFGREIDVLLLHDGEQYYCVKCSYRGKKSEVRSAYASHKKKYRNRMTRLSIEDIARL
jgi:hypothetical protein